MTNTSSDNQLREKQLFKDQLLQTVTTVALESVPGLVDLNCELFEVPTHGDYSDNHGASGVEVAVKDRQVSIQLDVIIEYGERLPEVYGKICQVVSGEIERMTDLETVVVNVNVVDIMTKEEYEAVLEEAQSSES